MRREIEIERERNGDLGDRPFFIAERAGGLMRDKEARKGNILRTKKDRDKEMGF